MDGFKGVWTAPLGHQNQNSEVEFGHRTESNLLHGVPPGQPTRHWVNEHNDGRADGHVDLVGWGIRVQIEFKRANIERTSHSRTRPTACRRGA